MYTRTHIYLHTEQICLSSYIWVYGRAKNLDHCCTLMAVSILRFTPMCWI